MALNAFICIGNSDNKLTQKRWAEFIEDIDLCAKLFQVHGRWFSAPDSQFQNAAWCIEGSKPQIDALRPVLALMAKRYEQDSIALTVGEPEFVEASP